MTYVDAQYWALVVDVMLYENLAVKLRDEMPVNEIFLCGHFELIHYY